MTRNFHYEAQQLMKAIDLSHDGQPCAEDIEGDWCEKCLHLQSEMIQFLISCPRWMVIASVLTIRCQELWKSTKNLIKLTATYPFRGRKGHSNV